MIGWAHRFGDRATLWAGMTAHRFSSLDGLRSVAAIMVLFFHARWWLSGGKFYVQHTYLAVDLFFMLSGFVVAHAYEARLLGGMHFVTFAKVRAIRLYPLIVTGALLGVLARTELPSSSEDLLTSLKAFPFAAASLPMPPGIMDEPFRLNGPAWSLFYELFINCVFALAIRFLRTPVVSGITIAGAIAYAWLAYAQQGVLIGWTYAALLPAFARVTFPFFFGVLLFRWDLAGRLPKIRAPFWLLCLLLIATFLPRRHDTINFVYDFVIVACVYPCLIIAGSQNEPSASWMRFVMWGGFLSYPLYVLQSPMLAMFQRIAAAVALPSPLYFPLAVAVIIPSCLLFGLADAAVRRRLATKLR